MFSIILFALGTAAVKALASPLAPQVADCDISHAFMRLPHNQTTIVPSGLPAEYVVLAIGYQNYDCTDGKYTNVGASAELYDISCLYELAFAEIQDQAYDGWISASPETAAKEVADLLDDMPKPVTVLGHHYFRPNPVTGKGLNPEWDFTSSINDPAAFVVAEKVTSIPAPSNPKEDVDWVYLKNLQGNLASLVYRVDTKGGQPKSLSCLGSSLAVKYTSKYWFHGGSIHN